MTTIYLHGYSGDSQGLSGFAEQMDYQPYQLWDLPGFRAMPILPDELKSDILAYVEFIWRDIAAAHPSGQLRLVGHSHGAMVAYALASLHPERIGELVLVCPVARPRWPTQALTKGLAGLSHALPEWLFMAFLRSPLLVDGIGRYMSSSYWSRQGRRRVRAIRRREARGYSRQMVDMFAQALSFADRMNDSSVDVPTVMCYASDDNVAGKLDLNWYFERCHQVRHCSVIQGGHLAVLAEPAEVAEALSP